MRRYLAGAFLVQSITQSSGAAIADMPGSSGSRWNWVAVIDPRPSYFLPSRYA
jgi:hypothetical protein